MQKFITMLEEATAKKLVLKAKDTAMDRAAENFALDFNEDNPKVSIQQARNAFIFAKAVDADDKQRDAWAKDPAALDKAIADEKWKKKEAAWARESEKFNKEPAKPKGLMSDKEFEKMVAGAKKDYLSDNPDGDIQDVAMDIADSLLYDKKLFDFLKYKYNTTDRGQIKALLADRIAG